VVSSFWVRVWVSGSTLVRESRINHRQSVNQTIAMIIGDFVLVRYHPFLRFLCFFLRGVGRYIDVGSFMDVDGALLFPRLCFILGI